MQTIPHQFMRCCFLCLMLLAPSTVVVTALTTTSNMPFTRLTNACTVAMATPCTVDTTTMTGAKQESVVAAVVIEENGSSVIKESSTKKQQQLDNTTSNKNDNCHEWWEIKLYNDDTNYREYVAGILHRFVSDMTPMKAFKCMKHADEHGHCILGTYGFELAEHYTSTLQDKGLHVEKIPVGGAGDFS